MFCPPVIQRREGRHRTAGVEDYITLAPPSLQPMPAQGTRRVARHPHDHQRIQLFITTVVEPGRSYRVQGIKQDTEGGGKA